MQTKYIFVTGGVVSSLGKGISASAIGTMLKMRGFKVFIQKFDPYINVDPGTMSPYQHGEVFVTDDGAETDLDLGHYERFIDINLTKESSITTGKIYQAVIQKERQGAYLGRTVQVIPHITDEIKLRLKDGAEKSQADIVIAEIGGTVGDIESLPYLEAIRQLRRDLGYENTLYIHTTLVPYLRVSNEIKTKPTQHSVKELRSLGISPDMMILRSEFHIDDEIKEKIALFCDVEKHLVFESLDVHIIYEAITNLRKQHIDEAILKHFKLSYIEDVNMKPWETLIEKIRHLKQKVTIGLVGKYVTLQDAYLSVSEALKHAGYFHNTHVEIKWFNAEKINASNVNQTLEGCNGILIPGGFGKRATKGKMLAITYAREHNIPFLGICYGMQLAMVEFAQNVMGLHHANTTEIDPDTKHPIFSLQGEKIEDLGGTLRLGLSKIKLKEDSKIFDAYQSNEIFERHRHRYEFNNAYTKIFEDHGMIVSGVYDKRDLVEAIELKNHLWFVAVQYHPEFLSRPLRAHPLFKDFIQYSLQNHKISQNHN